MTDNQLTILNVQERVDDVRKLRDLMQSLKDSFEKGVDYDVIPGTEKPTLLQPGAEKIMRALLVRAEYHDLPETTIDFDKPLFNYAYECRLVHIPTGFVVSSAKGSCNSYESKYRYRNAARVCPMCNQPSIIKGKAEYGGGWVCYKKKGGCGQTFQDGDSQIGDQRIGQVENEMIFDQVNTIQKMAQKRAQLSAVKCLAAVSEFFTVDLEDNAPARRTNNSTTSDTGASDSALYSPDADLGNDKARQAFFEFCKEELALKPNEVMAALKEASGGKITSLKGVRRGEALALLEVEDVPESDEHTEEETESF